MKENNLHNVKNTGFKTPDNYFENFEAKLNDRLSAENKIEDIDTTGFKIPDNYFEAFDERITKQLNKKDNKPVVKLNSRRRLYYISGIAASLLLFFTIFINKEEVTEISAEMVETYLEDQDLDSYELAQLLTDANVLEEDFTIIETNYNEDNLESYLLDNADIESIIE